MNVSTIRQSPSPQISWSTSSTQEKDADFLKLRLLNRRTRARISPQPLDLSLYDGKGTYFVVSNYKNWFAAIARNAQEGYQLLSSPLKELREFILSSKAEDEDDFSPKRTVPVVGVPVHLALAANDERLVVGFADGSVSIYDTSAVFSSDTGGIEAIGTFPPAPPGPLRQILGNPGDLAELVALRRDASSGVDGLVVEVVNVKSLKSVGGWRVGGTPGSIPTSIVWSPKGKQLAIGLSSGDIITYSPTDTRSPKLHVPRPPSAGDGSPISILWIANQDFYGIYTPAGNLSPEAHQKHVLIHYDPKTNSAKQTELETPYYPSPALRPPGAFTVTMRNWNPAKLLIFIGDSTSSDIGLVGSVTEADTLETWYNLALEETSTPSVPLDKDLEDTVPLALDLDLTSGQGEQETSGSPVMYLYASDGTLQAWFLSNEEGGPYPGMVVPAMTTPLGSQTGQLNSSSPAPPASTVLQPGKTQTTPPAFGSPGFGQPVSTPTLGQPLAFGQPLGTSSFGGLTKPGQGQEPSSGFGAFALPSSSFASTGFGFGTTNAPVSNQPGDPTVPSAPDVASPEAEMSEAEADKLGGLSLGGSGDDSGKAKDKPANSIFGSFATPSTRPALGGTVTAGSFGAFSNTQGTGFLKPASGFGAFLKPAEPQSTSKDSDSDKGVKPSPAFGGSGFGSPGFTSAKAQSGFGQPAFGQSSFAGSTAFGKPPSFGSASLGSSTTDNLPGGFGAFAGTAKGFGSFAQGGSAGFGQQAQSPQTKLSEAPSIMMASASEDASKGLSSSTTSDQQPSSPFSMPPGATTSPIPAAALPSSIPFGPSKGVSGQGPDGSRNPTPPKEAQEQTQNAVDKPAPREQSTASSPEGTPTLDNKPKPASLRDDSLDFADESITSPPPVQSTTPFGTPAPSVFKTSGAVPSAGAFGNLTSTPLAFKPAQGFGAFGSSTMTSSSPFTSPNVSTTSSAFTTPMKPMSAFGVGGSGPSSSFGASTVSSTTPKFGTPSTPTVSNLFGKSSFGTPTTPSPASTTPLATPAGNAFNAYGGAGGFSAFTKPGKPSSFSELLKAQKDDTGGASEKSKGPSSEKREKGEDLSFVSISRPEEVDHDNLPPTPSTHGTFDEEDQNLGEENEEEHDDASSFLSESFSGEEQEEGEAEEEEESEDSGEEAREAEASVGTKPTATPEPGPGSRESTPKSRLSDEKKDSGPQTDSPSGPNEPPTVFTKPESIAGAKPKSPAPDVNQAPPDDADGRKSAPPKSPPPLLSKPSTSAIPTLFGKPITPPGKPPAEATKPIVQIGSTTPPGTPSRPEEDCPLPAPKAVGASTMPTGPGWASSRPARSSPLAAAPVSGDESKGGQSSQSSQLTPPPPRPRPASPKMPFGQVPGAGSQQKPTLPSFANQNAPLGAANMRTVPLKSPQFGPSVQAPVFKPPAFEPTPASPLATGNAPFIMPSSTPAGFPGKPLTSLGATSATNTPTTGVPVQQFGQPTPRQPVQTTFESSMQRECYNLCISMMEEFEQLEKMSKAANGLRIMCSRPAAPSHSKEDLRDKTKWSFGDLQAFARIIKDLEKDILAVYRMKDEFLSLVREAESNLLKGETRKEEIIRFSKAKEDPEFAKMLKARTLNPDAAETQSQLRRQIRLINDRVEQLEAHLKSCKKKIEEDRTGKSSIKPPSLDTVNRIYRNIDLAIESQTQQIKTLTSRIAKLNVDELDSALHGTPSPRRKPSRTIEITVSHDEDRGEVSESASRTQVTPSIAASTAAALNAERSAMRLKNALMKARKVPLLNTQAIQMAGSVPTLESLPREVKSDTSSSAKSSGLPLDLDLSLDSSQTSEQEIVTESQRRNSRQFSHSKSVKLGKTHAPVPPSIAAFEWGPLPLPKTKPASLLPFDIKPASS